MWVEHHEKIINVTTTWTWCDEREHCSDGLCVFVHVATSADRKIWGFVSIHKSLWGLASPCENLASTCECSQTFVKPKWPKIQNFEIQNIFDFHATLGGFLRFGLTKVCVGSQTFVKPKWPKIQNFEIRNFLISMPPWVDFWDYNCFLRWVLMSSWGREWFWVVPWENVTYWAPFRVSMLREMICSFD